LSLLGAAALSRFAEKASGLRAHVLLGATVVLQLGFQAETVSVLWWKSPHYQSTAVASQFKGGPETIEYIDMNENQFQGQLMSPTRGISNCYDMDDFNRPDVGRGSTLIKRVAQDGQPMPTEPIVRARFVNWSRISLQVACAADSSASCSAQESSRLQFTLRQAYHPFWRASGCTTYADAQGDLAVDCPVVQLHRDQSIDLQFDDALSATASQITLCAWALWFPASGILLLIAGFARIRTLPALHAVTNAAAEG
jgi:hypothetical protein